MIPVDLAARLRLINEASFFDADQPVSGLQRAREIQSQLPDLQPGQRFFATLQRAQPDGSYRALVDGKPLTLALNSPGNAGDTLELEVSQVTSRAVFARVLGSEPGPSASAQPSLSQTGRLISFLLTGQPAPAPASLAGRQPLLNAPPTQGGTALVPLLRQAIGQSGLFYESHLAQWVLGKLDSAALAREPQAQAGASTAPNTAGPSASAGAGAGAGAGASASAGASAGVGVGASASAGASAGVGVGGGGAGGSGGATTAAVASAGSEGAPADSQAKPAGQAGATERAAPSASAVASESAAARATPIPERLLPIVHQQLDALATNQYLWQGQAWPGQPIELLIEDPDEDSERTSDGEDSGASEASWNTTLRLTMPRLGGLEAEIQLSAAGVALRLRADGDAALAALHARRGELASALDVAGLNLTSIALERRDV